MSRAHQKLTAWQVARSLVNDVYKLTAGLPKSEMYGLTSQMRRAAVSVPANIAEGAARLSAREFRRFLAVSRGSLAELETHMILAKDLGFLEQSVKLDCKIERLFGLLSGLINHQNNQISEADK